MILKVQNKPSSIYFKNLFNDNDIDWAAIYMLPCQVTYKTYMQPTCDQNLTQCPIFCWKKNVLLFFFRILDSISKNPFFENNKAFVNHILLIFKLLFINPEKQNP